MFKERHIGPSSEEIQSMLNELGVNSLNALVAQTVPENIALKKKLAVDSSQSEIEAIAKLKEKAEKNRVYKSFLGQGYVQPIVPPVIQRNIFENPCWYTQYTPYQAEIAQGRLEALLNFQTMVCDLTGMQISNASLLDEATAVAEAVSMANAIRGSGTLKKVFLANDVYQQTKDVVRTRCEAVDVEVVEGSRNILFERNDFFAAILQNPTDSGEVFDLKPYLEKLKQNQIISIISVDFYSLCLITPPGEQGADIVVGSTQAFGVPMGFGGPHAAFLATKEEFKRLIPGRLVSVSKDALGNQAYRLALQTREQHIRREKATSNICTAQVLLAVMASMYAVYHGPSGLKNIAKQIARMTYGLAEALREQGARLSTEHFFNTITIEAKNAKTTARALEQEGYLVRVISDQSLQVTIDESTTHSQAETLLRILTGKPGKLRTTDQNGLPEVLLRTSPFLTHPIFQSIKSETDMLRYITALSSKDLSLAHSMIPLGSCTMKLNATTEMLPVTWPEFSNIHPFAPESSTRGYIEIIEELEKDLAEVTGFSAVSLQPNAGSQGEYAGLLAIRGYHRSRGDFNRDVCMIPQSAHGTNPASAVLAGMKVVVVACDADGNISESDLSSKIEAHRDRVAAMMITYPSTHGVFEENIRALCEKVHQAGGQVYMDGANMNAQVGLTRPGDFGPDVCHLNLHKTFCIPHGGGGPGVGPIGVKAHLAPFLPSHFRFKGTVRDTKVGAVSAAPFGSASILVIPYLYIKMMGPDGLKYATEVAILNANYMAKRLSPHYPVLYKGRNGFVAHECILDLRQLKEKTGIEVEDVAKRLMDYGFHAPTVSFPVAGTVMIEPTESESKAEMDRYCEAMISIRDEIRSIEKGAVQAKESVLKHAPHTIEAVSATEWNHPYSREQAAYPLKWLRRRKFWPSVSRIDNVFGERNLVCTCPSIEDYS